MVKYRHSLVLILSLLASNLILLYILIVAQRSYVEKLALVAQSSVFKRRTALALDNIMTIISQAQDHISVSVLVVLSYYIIQLYTVLFFFNTTILRSNDCTRTSVPPILS